MQKWPLQYRKSPAWRRSFGDELTARFRMRTEHPLTIQSGPRDAFIHESYRQWFQGGQEPGSNANLIEGLRAIGQLPDRVMELANGAAIDQALTEETDTARALGIFGAPTFVVGDQLFWGDDRLEDAVSYAKYGRVNPR